MSRTSHLLLGLKEGLYSPLLGRIWQQPQYHHIRSIFGQLVWVNMINLYGLTVLLTQVWKYSWRPLTDCMLVMFNILWYQPASNLIVLINFHQYGKIVKLIQNPNQVLNIGQSFPHVILWWVGIVLSYLFLWVAGLLLPYSQYWYKATSIGLYVVFHAFYLLDYRCQVLGYPHPNRVGLFQKYWCYHLGILSPILLVWLLADPVLAGALCSILFPLILLNSVYYPLPTEAFYPPVPILAPCLSGANYLISTVHDRILSHIPLPDQ